MFGPSPWWRVAAALLLCATTTVSAAPAISIIIDDLGDRWREGHDAVTLPGAVACAFLPHSPHTRTLANLAHAGGKPVLLHLPLEPVAGRPHPLALKTGDGSDRRTQQLATMLAAVPYARGVNNHQGSRATASHEQMHWLMRELSLRGIDYFVDSATSAASVAYPLARAYGLPATRRQVFLDNDPSPAAVRIEFERLLRIARRDGRALAIGHPHAGTLAVLRERLPQLAAEGIELITPQQLIARSRQAPAAPKPRLRLAMQLGSPTEVAQQGLAP